ncbi:hypothetical protein [Methylobacterium segetis]|uniref:hypothetical protein n=1 Tax=Methylobacterium segetis TaxID=2488750 RepID=UPI00104BD704|nr:hypothetical protein [Methylobacterium segetis]
MSSAPRSGHRRAPAAVALVAAGWVMASAAFAAEGVSETPGPPPLVLARDVAGAAGAPIPLAIEVQRLPDRSDPSTYLLGLPKGARVADATHAVTAAEEKSIVEVTGWNLPDLSVTLQPEQTGTFTLAVAALTRPGNGEPLRLARSTFTINAQAPDLPEPAPLADPGPVKAAAQMAAPAVAALEANVPQNLPANSPANLPANLPAPAPAGAAEIYVPQLPPIAPLEPKAPIAKLNPVKSSPAKPSPPDPSLAGPSPAKPSALTPGDAKPAPLPQPTEAQAPTRTAQAQAAKAPAPGEPSPRALVERAERLIRLGDISGARLVLERAMERGEPRAAFLLAQTCDPRMLRAWKVQGLQADPERASALYARAAREGLADPKSLADAMR